MSVLIHSLGTGKPGSGCAPAPGPLGKFGDDLERLGLPDTLIGSDWTQVARHCADVLARSDAWQLADRADPVVSLVVQNFGLPEWSLVSTIDLDKALGRFVADARSAAPITAVWVHGSLALGDYQQGRSDLDLIAVVGSELSAVQKRDLERVHRDLIRQEPVVTKLHCSYMNSSSLADAGTRHFTWAQGQVLNRAVTPVTRRELHVGQRSLYGPSPVELLPPVSDQQLDEFVRRDLREYWQPIAGKRMYWMIDLWVDLGMLTVARATATLRDGRLITKGEALEELGSLRAPVEVVENIRQRRYGQAIPLNPYRRARRARRTGLFMRSAIKAALALPTPV
jgi:hypothetical protein